MEFEDPSALGYENDVNRLTERQIQVTDDSGQPAVRGYPHAPIGSVQLKIAWTYTSQYEWNYCLPEFPGGADSFGSKYPSELLYFHKKLGVKTVLRVEIPETPYAFFVFDGEISPYFQDQKKAVVWQFSGVELEKAFSEMRVISTSEKVLTLVAPGGDMAVYLIVDFTDRDTSPKVTYYEEYHGF